MYQKMISPFNIGQSLRMAQKLTGMTNGQVAESTGVGPIQVSRWRQWSDMKYSRVNQLADLFHMSVEDFVKLGGYSVQEPMTEKAMQRLQDIVPVQVEVVAHAGGVLGATVSTLLVAPSSYPPPSHVRTVPQTWDS